MTVERWHSCSDALCLMLTEEAECDGRQEGRVKGFWDMVGGRGEKQLVPACEIPCEIPLCPTTCLSAWAPVLCPRDSTECPERARKGLAEPGQALVPGRGSPGQGSKPSAWQGQTPQLAEAPAGLSPCLQQA